MLIANKDTSCDEIQAFFYRAILCKFNALFVVGIDESFTEYQQSIMNNIDNLLSFQKNKHKEETKKEVDKLKTDKYLDSYIVFIYDKENINITSFINEIKKYTPDKDGKNPNKKIYSSNKIDYINTKEEDKNYSPKFKNILVITSDICGLGKSEKIKK